MAALKFENMDTIYNAAVKYIELEDSSKGTSVRGLKSALHVIENRTGIWLDENDLFAVLEDLKIKFLDGEKSCWHLEPDMD